MKQYILTRYKHLWKVNNGALWPETSLNSIRLRTGLMYWNKKRNTFTAYNIFIIIYILRHLTLPIIPIIQSNFIVFYYFYHNLSNSTTKSTSNSNFLYVLRFFSYINYYSNEKRHSLYEWLYKFIYQSRFWKSTVHAQWDSWL